jgi:hypothetical protein
MLYADKPISLAKQVEDVNRSGIIVEGSTVDSQRLTNFLL